MYRGQPGMWAWLLHRIAGLGILLFLLVHIVDISLLAFGPSVYNEGVALFSTPLVRIVSLALIAAVFYHSLNGIRIMLIDFVPEAVRYQKSMFWAVMILTVVLALPIAYFVVLPIFQPHAISASGM